MKGRIDRVGSMTNARGTEEGEGTTRCATEYLLYSKPSCTVVMGDASLTPSPRVIIREHAMQLLSDLFYSFFFVSSSASSLATVASMLRGASGPSKKWCRKPKKRRLVLKTVKQNHTPASDPP